MSSPHWNADDALAFRWTEAAFDRLVDGTLRASVERKNGVRTVRVDGACPHCDHNVEFDMIIDGGLAISAGTLGDGPGPDGEFMAVVVTCMCRTPDANRPQDQKYGCGVHFTIDIEVPA